MPRIRHCVECPQCLTRYLISSSPYGNGSYLIPTVDGSRDEYILYCSCRAGTAASRWKWSEVKTCEVLKTAYDRGYGSSDEILLIDDEPPGSWPFDVSQYVDRRKSLGRRKNSP
jgi:hypothetical protein